MPYPPTHEHEKSECFEYNLCFNDLRDVYV